MTSELANLNLTGFGLTKADLDSYPPATMVARIESGLLSLPHLSEADGPGFYRLMAEDFPLTEIFCGDAYYREVVMPQGALIIGHLHRTRHLNSVVSGSALVSMNGEVKRIVAPCVFISQPGVRKVLLIEEDCRWGTFHVTRTTDPVELRAELIEESEDFVKHQLEQDAEKLIAFAKEREG